MGNEAGIFQKRRGLQNCEATLANDRGLGRQVPSLKRDCPVGTAAVAPRRPRVVLRFVDWLDVEAYAGPAIQKSDVEGF